MHTFKHLLIIYNAYKDIVLIHIYIGLDISIFKTVI